MIQVGGGAAADKITPPVGVSQRTAEAEPTRVCLPVYPPRRPERSQDTGCQNKGLDSPAL